MFDFVPGELLVLAGVILLVGLVAAFLWDRRRNSDDDEDR